MSRATKKQTSQVVIMGKPSSGKTQLTDRIVRDVYTDNYISMIHVEHKQKSIKRGDIEFGVQFWDMPGSSNEITDVTRRVSLKGAAVFIIVLDLTDIKESFHYFFDKSGPKLYGATISNHFKDLKPNDQQTECIIVYTKSDDPNIAVPTPKKQVQHRQQLAKGLGISEDRMTASFVTSAKKRTGTNEVLEGILTIINPQKPSDSFVFDLSGGAASAGIFGTLFGKSDDTASGQSDAEALGIEPSF